jgi:ABC-type dipeptide/oligopeptide/nickel transport system permease component
MLARGHGTHAENRGKCMLRLLLKRLIGLLFVVLCVTFITFIMGYLAPGDPIKGMLGEHYDPALYAQLRHQYGLDAPWYQQYFKFLSGLLRLDFGYSYHYQGENVWDLLQAGVPVSSELALWGIFVTWLIGVPVGILAAVKANGWLDTTTMSVVLVLYSLPQFVLAVLVQLAIIWQAKWTGVSWPVSNWGTPWQYSWGDIQLKLIPILVYGAVSCAFVARLTRTSMLEVFGQDYIRTARAKGLRERTVIYQHALRNAIIPLISYLGYSLGTLIISLFFIEKLFNIPGVGTIALSAIGDRDYPVIQATTVLAAVTVVIGNLISDILYIVIDPRIRSD